MPAFVKRLLLCFALFSASSVSGAAEPLDPVTGDVMMTVRGGISVTNAEGEAVFDQALLEAMGVDVVETGTIWTEGVRKFEGVSLDRLLERLGAKGSAIRLTALNEYAVEFPMDVAAKGGPILAYRMDGVALSPRDKGPIWMIFPFDTAPQYQNEVSYSRSVWQLHMIEVLP